MTKKIVQLDIKISQWLYNLQPKGSADDVFFENITRVYGVIPATLIALLFTKNLIATLIILAIIIVINYFIVENFIKKIVKRERPAFREKRLRTYSFPSTHSTTMGMIAGQFLLIPNLYYYERSAFWIFIIWGLVVMLSRVIYGHHFILDVIAGFTLGLIATFPLMLINGLL